jgi:hypothetical protein
MHQQCVPILQGHKPSSWGLAALCACPAGCLCCCLLDTPARRQQQRKGPHQPKPLGLTLMEDAAGMCAQGALRGGGQGRQPSVAGPLLGASSSRGSSARGGAGGSSAAAQLTKRMRNTLPCRRWQHQDQGGSQCDCGQSDQELTSPAFYWARRPPSMAGPYHTSCVELCCPCQAGQPARLVAGPITGLLPYIGKWRRLICGRDVAAPSCRCQAPVLVLARSSSAELA